MHPSLLAFGVSLATLLGGVVATYCYDSRKPLSWRVPAGACSALAALGLIGFVLAMRFGLTSQVAAAAAVAVASPTLLLLRERYRRMLRDDVRAAIRWMRLSVTTLRGRTLVLAVAYGIGAVLLWRVADRTMYVQDDGIYTGVSHNIGDLPFHLTVTNRFVYGRNFPPEHPSFAGASFTYPFLADFIGGVFVAAGAPIRDVIVWSTWLLCASLAILLYRWTLALVGSRDAALLAPPVAFLSGGLGFAYFAADAWRSGSVWTLLARLPHDYTITADNQFRWGNLVTSLLVTQRGLLLGLPLAIVVFELWWDVWTGDDDDARDHQRRMIAAGVLAGMLPLVHAHSFAVVIAVAACLAVLSDDRWEWLPFFAWAFALGLPQIWWVIHASGIHGQSFVRWSPGWDHGDQNVILFWLKNTGLFIPLLVAAFVWRSSDPPISRRLVLFYLPFTLCFIVPNLFGLAPWIWDNIKVLVYWFIASVPLVALALSRVMGGRHWRTGFAMALLIPLTLAGTLDIWRVASGAFQFRVFDRGGIAFARVVVDRTDPRSLILHAPIPNHPIALTGRRSLMGYPGHVWSHGLDPGIREADIRRMYAGGPDAAALLARYGIDYVVVGPAERSQLTVDERFFERYRCVGEAGRYRLFQINGGH